METFIVRLVFMGVLFLAVASILVKGCSPGSGSAGLAGRPNVPGTSFSLAGSSFPVSFYANVEEAINEAKRTGKRLFIINAAPQTPLFMEAFSVFSDMQSTEAVAVQTLVKDYYVVCIPRRLPHSIPSLGWQKHLNKVLLMDPNANMPHYVEDRLEPVTRFFIKDLATFAGVQPPMILQNTL